MSRSDLERLLDDVRTDPSLMEDLRCRVHDRDSAIEWARQRGYVLGSEDVTALADGDRELSDDELEDAAGGDWSSGTGGGTPPPPAGP